MNCIYVLFILFIFCCQLPVVSFPAIAIATVLYLIMHSSSHYYHKISNIIYIRSRGNVNCTNLSCSKLHYFCTATDSPTWAAGAGEEHPLCSAECILFIAHPYDYRYDTTHPKHLRTQCRTKIYIPWK